MLPGPGNTYYIKVTTPENTADKVVSAEKSQEWPSEIWPEKCCLDLETWSTTIPVHIKVTIPRTQQTK
jgi:hypothetical protein